MRSLVPQTRGSHTLVWCNLYLIFSSSFVIYMGEGMYGSLVPQTRGSHTLVWCNLYLIFSSSFVIYIRRLLPVKSLGGGGPLSHKQEGLIH
jgi:hypothetical protein